MPAGAILGAMDNHVPANLRPGRWQQRDRIDTPAYRGRPSRGSGQHELRRVNPADPSVDLSGPVMTSA